MSVLLATDSAQKRGKTSRRKRTDSIFMLVSTIRLLFDGFISAGNKEPRYRRINNDVRIAPGNLSAALASITPGYCYA